MGPGRRALGRAAPPVSRRYRITDPLGWCRTPAASGRDGLGEGGAAGEGRGAAFEWTTVICPQMTQIFQCPKKYAGRALGWGRPGHQLAVPFFWLECCTRRTGPVTETGVPLRQGEPYAARGYVVVFVTIDVAGGGHLPPLDGGVPRLQVVGQSARCLGDDLETTRDRVEAQFVVLERFVGQIGDENFDFRDVVVNVQKPAMQLFRVRRHRSRRRSRRLECAVSIRHGRRRRLGLRTGLLWLL